MEFYAWVGLNADGVEDIVAFEDGRAVMPVVSRQVEDISNELAMRTVREYVRRTGRPLRCAVFVEGLTMGTVTPPTIEEADAPREVARAVGKLPGRE